jgi:hypothetical protein
VKIYRIVRWVVLAGLVVSVFLLFKTPDPVSRPQDSRTVASNVESYQTKLQQLQDAKEHGESAEVHLTADEVSAAMSQAGRFQFPQSRRPPRAALPLLKNNPRSATTR